MMSLMSLSQTQEFKISAKSDEAARNHKILAASIIIWEHISGISVGSNPTAPKTRKPNISGRRKIIDLWRRRIGK